MAINREKSPLLTPVNCYLRVGVRLKNEEGGGAVGRSVKDEGGRRVRGEVGGIEGKSGGGSG